MKYIVGDQMSDPLEQAIDDTWVKGLRAEKAQMDIAMQVRVWRENVRLGALTPDQMRDQMREAIIILRANRKKWQEVGEIKKEKKAAKVTNVKGLLDDFKNQMGEGIK